jgi:uncharacterized protein YbcI
MSNGQVSANTASAPSGEVKPFSPSVAISNRMVRLLASYMGRGPTRARTTLATNLVVVVFGDAMTRAERNLVAAGEPEAVVSMRRVLHGRMRGEAIVAVEEIVGAKVIACLSDIDTEADIAVLAFALEPAEQGHTAPLP